MIASTISHNKSDLFSKHWSKASCVINTWIDSTAMRIYGPDIVFEFIILKNGSSTVLIFISIK